TRFFFSSRRRHTRFSRDWSSDVCSSDLIHWGVDTAIQPPPIGVQAVLSLQKQDGDVGGFQCVPYLFEHFDEWVQTQPADRDPMRSEERRVGKGSSAGARAVLRGDTMLAR